VSAPGRFVLREGTDADQDAIADNLVAGLATYRAWAPPGWAPPGRAALRAALQDRIPATGFWSLLAFADGEPAGHVAFRPERDRGDRPVDGLAHLMHLFVREPFWGGGLAGTLHDAVIAHMAADGFRSALLWTPAGHARARAFYERRGWRLTGGRDPASDLGLPCLEYALELWAPGPGGGPPPSA
jgi:RimJ/RimL family protein N-acetyltransferase